MAYNDVGDSPDSSRITLQSQVQTAGVPDAPTGLTVTEDTAGEVTISWRIPSGGPQATGHNIYRQHIGHTEFELLAAAPAGTTSVSDDTVEAEQWYGYYVKAVNAAGESTASGTDLINTKPQTVGVPEQPASLDAAEDVTGEVTLSWSAPGNGPAPTGYSVYREEISVGNTDGMVLRNYLKTIEAKRNKGYAWLSEALGREERRDGEAGIAGNPVGSSG